MIHGNVAVVPYVHMRHIGNDTVTDVERRMTCSMTFGRDGK
jgi:hypothetical protein